MGSGWREREAETLPIVSSVADSHEDGLVAISNKGEARGGDKWGDFAQISLYLLQQHPRICDILLESLHEASLYHSKGPPVVSS